MNKPAIQLTTTWVNVSATFTSGKTYTLQNNGLADVLLYEGATPVPADAFVIQRNNGAGVLVYNGTPVWLKSVTGTSLVAVMEV